MNIIERARVAVGDWLLRGFSLNAWERYLDSMYAAPSASGIAISEKSALKWSAVWACVNNGSQDFAKLPCVLYRRVGANGQDGREVAYDHPLYRTLTLQANPYMSAYTFRQVMQRSLLIRGNAYAHIVTPDGARQRDIELWPLHPDTVRPKIEADGSGRLSLVYEYVEPHSTQRTMISADRMFHLRGLSHDGIVGVSPLECFADMIGLGLGYQDHAARTLRNGVRPSVNIVLPESVGPEKAAQLAEHIRATYGGTENSGKPLVLFGGAKVESVGFTNRDAQIIESERFAVADCSRVWRMPLHKLADLTDAHYNNITSTNIEYVQDHLRPWQVCWEQEISLKLIDEQARRTLYAEHDNMALLKGTPKERAEIEEIYVRSGISTINEVRRSHNWNPVPGGDKARTQMQNVALEDVDALAQKGGNDGTGNSDTASE